MKIKEATFMKSIKIGLPNYSNTDVSFGMTVEVKEGEKLDMAECWDTVNRELAIQSQGIDPDWINTKEYSNYFKTTVKTKKAVK